jgi:N-acetylmuramoyl-L-alanine amidase
MKVGLIIGHKPNRPGACNKSYRICEYQFNDALACDIYDKLKKDFPEIDVRIIRRRTYKTLPGDVNKINPKFAISLHCNAFNGQWNGTEVLYYHTSKNGKRLAQLLQTKLVKALGFEDRGILPRTTEDRGGTLLRYTKMPCVIAEPFFIDNAQAFMDVQKNYSKLVNAYADTIVEMVKILRKK